MVNMENTFPTYRQSDRSWDHMQLTRKRSVLRYSTAQRKLQRPLVDVVLWITITLFNGPSTRYRRPLNSIKFCLRKKAVQRTVCCIYNIVSHTISMYLYLVTFTGPLAEVIMPIDPFSRLPKGFATITFVMPEHAVKAYTELDGTAFCGRMLHLLPAKTEKLENDDDDGMYL